MIYIYRLLPTDSAVLSAEFAYSLMIGHNPDTFCPYCVLMKISGSRESLFFMKYLSFLLSIPKENPAASAAGFFIFLKAAK